jgi:hypothetical protein
MKKKQQAIAITKMEIAYISGKSRLQLVLISEFKESVMKLHEEPARRL